MDWAAPLRLNISENYGKKVADEQGESSAKLNEAMKQVLQNSKNANKSSLENLKVYLRLLGVVHANFLIGETAVKIRFIWNDSFNPTKNIIHQTIGWERAAVLFNYAVMESHIGTSIDRKDFERIKKACTHFLTAARYFEY